MQGVITWSLCVSLALLMCPYGHLRTTCQAILTKHAEISSTLTTVMSGSTVTVSVFRLARKWLTRRGKNYGAKVVADVMDSL